MFEIYKNKKVFITGHSGFKGSWLTSILIKFGAIVKGYSLPPEKRSHINSLLNSDFLDSNFTHVYNDIRNLNILEKELTDFDPHIIFHLAAQPIVRKSYTEPLFTYESNVIGTLNLLLSSQKCKNLNSIVIITTDKVYENRENIKPYSEDDRLGGYDLYSSSKACSEILTESFKRSFYNLDKFKLSHNVLIATARAGNVLGGGDWSVDRLIPDIIKSIYNNDECIIRSPESIRPWQHVLDCLNGYLILGEKLINQNKEFSSSWNFSPNSNEIVTVKDMINKAKKTWSLVNVKYPTVKTNKHESKILLLNSSKSNSMLKWFPKYDTNLTIEKTINWYKSLHQKNEILTFKQIEDFFDL